MKAAEMLRLLSESRMLDEESTVDDLITAIVEILIEKKQDEYSELTKDLVRSVYGDQTFSGSEPPSKNKLISDTQNYLYHVAGSFVSKGKMKDLLTRNGLSSHCARGNWVLKEGILYLIDGQRIYFHKDPPHVNDQTLLLRIAFTPTSLETGNFNVLESHKHSRLSARNFGIKNVKKDYKSSIIPGGVYIESQYPFTIPPWCIEYYTDQGTWSELTPSRESAARSFLPTKRSLRQTMPLKTLMNLDRLNIDANDIDMMENYAIISYMGIEDPALSDIRIGNVDFAFIDVCTPADFRKALKRIESEDKIPVTEWKTI